MVCKQIDCVAMGSPLGPLLANLFVVSKEKPLLSLSSEQKPIYNARYVDDIFVLMKNINDFDSFYYAMNSLHSNLTVTLEIPANTKLPFFDT